LSVTFRFRSAVDRRARLLELIRENGYGNQGELARSLGVSEMTIRRDARRLEAEGLARSVRGGILSVAEPAPLVDYRLREQRNLTIKRAIAQAAVALIESGTTIALDAGTTTLELAKLLMAPMQVKVVTSSLPAINVLAGRPDIETIALGGTLIPELLLFNGPLTLAALRQLHVDQVFLAATSITKGTMYCNAMWESERKRALMEIGDEVIVMTDSSKFGLSAMVRVGPMSVASTLVVDDKIAPADLEAMQSAGIRVVVVPTSDATGEQSAALYPEQYQ
jgi:DeoR family transcriptional regulator, aga operon transcriptional repressor